MKQFQICFHFGRRTLLTNSFIMAYPAYKKACPGGQTLLVHSLKM